MLVILKLVLISALSRSISNLLLVNFIFLIYLYIIWNEINHVLDGYYLVGRGISALSLPCCLLAWMAVLFIDVLYVQKQCYT